MPQPTRSFVDAAGQAWLELDNGHRIRLPDPGTGSGDGGSTTPPPVTEVTEHEVSIGPSTPADALAELWVDTDDPTTDAGLYVLKAGDTMTGALTIRPATGQSQFDGRSVDAEAYFRLFSPAGKHAGFMFRDQAGPTRWLIGKHDGAETGSDAGSDLIVYKYNDAGTQTGTAVRISRATGAVTLIGPLTLPADPTSALQAATKQYADAIGSTARLTISTGSISQNTTVHLPFTAVNDSRGISLGSIVSGKFRLTKPGLYLVTAHTVFITTSGDNVQFTVSGTARFVAGNDFWVTTYFLAPYAAYAMNTYSIGMVGTAGSIAGAGGYYPTGLGAGITSSSGTASITYLGP